jgi:hypothetical protein
MGMGGIIMPQFMGQTMMRRRHVLSVGRASQMSKKQNKEIESLQLQIQSMQLKIDGKTKFIEQQRIANESATLRIDGLIEKVRKAQPIIRGLDLGLGGFFDNLHLDEMLTKEEKEIIEQTGQKLKELRGILDDL